MLKTFCTSVALAILLVACGDVEPSESLSTRGSALCETQSANILIDSELKALAYAERGCTVLEGDMLITDISELPTLPTEEIRGHLIIRDSELENLSGLINLRAVDAITVTLNSELRDASLDKLESVTSRLHIVENPVLGGMDLPALDSSGSIELVANTGMIDLTSAVTTIATDLKVIDQPAFQTIGLTSLTTVGGNVVLDSLVSLDSLDGLEAVESIGENLDISRLNSLTTMQGLVALTDVGGRLAIRDNPQLASLTGLETVTSVGGLLAIADCPQITTLEGLHRITRVNDLYIGRVGALNDLEGVRALQEIREYFRLDTVPLADITDLSVFPTIEVQNFQLIGADTILTVDGMRIAENGTVRIVASHGIDTIAAFDGVTRLDTLHVIGNESFDFVDIDTLTHVDYLDISGNTGFDRVGLPALETARFFEFESNSPVPDLSGLGSLNAVSVNLYIRYNARLVSLDGMGALKDVGNRLRISNNGDLTSLDAVTLDSARNVDIYSNSDLPECQATEFIARMTTPPNNTSVYSNTGTGTCN